MKNDLKILSLFLTLFCMATLAFAKDTELTIVALGDSTTAGTPGFTPSLSLHAAGRGDVKSQYAYWLMQKNPKWKVLNRGVNGERSDQILSRFDRDVLGNKPDTVVVVAGVNDIFQRKPIKGIQDNLMKLHAKAKENEIGFILCTILPYDIASPEAFENIQKMNQWILEYSKKENLESCDTFKATAHPKNPRMLVSSADHIHPDAEAYKKMSEEIETAINKWLKKSL